MRRIIIHQVNPKISDNMAMPTAFCKSGNFDSIDPVETTTDAPTGRAGPSLPGRSDPRALFSGREFSCWAVQPDREALCR